MTRPQSSRNRQSYICCLVLACCLTLVAGCCLDFSEPVPTPVVTPTVELPFTSIEARRNTGTEALWRRRCPGMIVVAQSHEIARLSPYVSQAAVGEVQASNLDHRICVAVFEGYLEHGHEGFRVTRVVRRGDAVDLYAVASEATWANEEVSPYDIVLIEKTSSPWGRPIRLTLYIEDAFAVAVDHQVPFVCHAPSPTATPGPSPTPTITNTPGPTATFTPAPTATDTPQA